MLVPTQPVLSSQPTSSNQHATLTQERERFALGKQSGVLRQNLMEPPSSGVDSVLVEQILTSAQKKPLLQSFTEKKRRTTEGKTPLSSKKSASVVQRQTLSSGLG